MNSSTTLPPTVRRPTQERGRRRFDAILDAAAAILVESGMAGFTVHGVAARANTSIGSMYHFFPDGESVLRALGERHIAELEELLRGIRATEDVTWASAPLSEAVAGILDPMLSYLEAHPDLFALPHNEKPDDCAPDGHGLDTMSIEIFERFIHARTPGASMDERQLRARMILGITEGVATRAAHYPVPARPALLRELRVAVVAYLGVYEK